MTKTISRQGPLKAFRTSTFWKGTFKRLFLVSEKGSPLIGLCPVRWILAFLAFVGFIFNYMLRVNINFTIVSMVNFTVQSKENVSNECNFTISDEDQVNANEGEFLWDSVVQSQIIGNASKKLGFNFAERC